MHFSSPSGQRLSWWRPWNRGAVGSFCSGYCTVSTLRNICLKVTAKPLTGLRKSSTGDLRHARRGQISIGGVELARLGALRQDAVVVRQVHRRDREGRADLLFEFDLGEGLSLRPFL